METLVVSQQRNQHQGYGRNRSSTPKFGSYGSPPSSGFRGINCRTFHSDTGSLPMPLTSCSMIPVINRAFSASFSPRTPSSSVNYKQKNSKSNGKSSSIPIPIKIEFENEDRLFGDQLHFSERWAGPAYSNSPPPSSLPMPKFSLPPKRTVSLNLPFSASEINFRPVAKSAPASPTRDRSPFPCNLREPSDSATLTLRRILNLDISDE